MKFVALIFASAIACSAATPVQSPRLAELFPVRVVANSSQSISPAATSLPPGEDPEDYRIKLNASWDTALTGGSYTLLAGTNSGSWTTTVTNTTASSADFTLLWFGDIARLYFTVLAEGYPPSKEAVWPPPPPTHVVISWSGPRTNIFQSVKVPAVWQLLTNSASPVTLPIQSGSRLFTAGVPLRITGTNINVSQ